MKKATKQKKEQGNQSIVSQVEEQLKKLKDTKDGITDTMSGYGMEVPKAFSKYPVVLAETCHNLEEKMEMLTIEPELARRISELETKMDAVYGKRFATDLSVLVSTEPGERNTTLHSVPEEVASGASKITASRFRNFHSLEHANFKQAETIGDNAFTNCSSLLVADFPAATTIGQYAFQNDTSLESINFPVATTIGQYAFQNDTSLTEANFSAATTIGQYAFQNATSLTRANFPEVTEMGQYAFQYDASLQSVSEMDGVETIPVGCFGSCNQLSSVSFPNARTIATDAFTQCHSLTGVNIPEARTIGNTAFYNNKALVSASFNKMNSAIGNGAFQLNTSLQYAHFPNATSVGEHSFQGDYALEDIDFSSATSLGMFAFGDCESLTEVNFPSVTTLYHHAFKNCTSLTAFSAENLKTINELVFQNVPIRHLNLSGVTFARPNCLEWFKGETVDFESLTAFNSSYAIVNDTGATTYVAGLNNSNNYTIKAIHAPNLEICNAGTPFHLFKALSGITLQNYKYGEATFQFENCDQLEYAYLPEYRGRNSNDWTVPAQMFDNCDSLSSAYIPSATGLHSKAFAFCPNLKLLGIPNVTYVNSTISTDTGPFYAGTAIPKFPEYVDYRERTSVITGFKVGSSSNQPATAVFHNTVKFIVPDNLYDEWCASPAFSACSARVVKQSWFENEGPNYQYTSGW